LCSFRDDAPNTQEADWRPQGVSLEVRWGEGWGHSCGDRGLGRKYGIWRSRSVDRGGGGMKYGVKNKQMKKK
jgi:hypothetical protein